MHKMNRARASTLQVAMQQPPWRAKRLMISVSITASAQKDAAASKRSTGNASLSSANANESWAASLRTYKGVREMTEGGGRKRA